MEFVNNNSLTSFSVEYCPSLMSVPDLQGLTSLRSITISYCKAMQCLSEGFQSLTALEDLTISKCPKLQIMSDLFPSLKKLWIEETNGGSLNSITSKLSSLTSLSVRGISDLTHLPHGLLETNKLLQKFEIRNCPNLQGFLPNVEGMHVHNSLEICKVTDCRSLRSLDLPSLKNLQKLKLGSFSEDLCYYPLESFNFQENFLPLQRLEIRGWARLEFLPEKVQHLIGLKHLIIRDFFGLVSLPEWFEKLLSLESLAIVNCENLTHLPDAIQQLTCLERYTMNEKVPLTAFNRRRKKELAREGDLVTYKRKRKTIDPSTVVPPNTVDSANEGVSEALPPTESVQGMNIPEGSEFETESAQAALGAQPPLPNVSFDFDVNIPIVGGYSEGEGATSNDDVGPSDKSLLRSFRFHRARSIALGQGLDRIGDISYNYYNSTLISAFVERWQPETNSFHFKWGEMTPTLDDVKQLVGLPADGNGTIIGGTWGFLTILEVFENNLLQDLNAFKSLKAGGVGNSLSLKKLKEHYEYKSASKKKKGLTMRYGGIALLKFRETLDNYKLEDVIWDPYRDKRDSPHEFKEVTFFYSVLASPDHVEPYYPNKTSECDLLKEIIEQMKVEIELKRVVDEQCVLEFTDLPRQLNAKRQKLVNAEERMKSLEANNTEWHNNLVNSEERKKTFEVDNNEWV
ncbi:hypothetical protein GIB67_042962 [Kingdonia uniflora]|uniref:Aminotransferase-like plant mobile domain-containing protein n=1 Tax=Kingdonia uniflora TaxID=39325 RepID=A0A7J7L620_9MAGN|nr:hypothetical protein GIB67_042962 [Kingdonia uniflora]